MAKMGTVRMPTSPVAAVVRVPPPTVSKNQKYKKVSVELWSQRVVFVRAKAYLCCTAACMVLLAVVQSAYRCATDYE